MIVLSEVWHHRTNHNKSGSGFNSIACLTGRHACQRRRFSDADIGTTAIAFVNEGGVLYGVLVRVVHLVGDEPVAEAYTSKGFYNFNDVFAKRVLVGNICRRNWLSIGRDPSVVNGRVFTSVFEYKHDYNACADRLLLSSGVNEGHTLAISPRLYHTYSARIDACLLDCGMLAPPQVPLDLDWGTRLCATGWVLHFNEQLWDFLLVGVSRCGAPVLLLTRDDAPYHIIAHTLLYPDRCFFDKQPKLGRPIDANCWAVISQVMREVSVPASNVLSKDNPTEIVLIKARNNIGTTGLVGGFTCV
jgi:hypothetical protein